MLENNVQRKRANNLVSYIRACHSDSKSPVDFDPIFYQLFYDDMINISDPKLLLDHYTAFGSHEGRYPSVARLLEVCESKPQDLPEDFNPMHYIIKNFDVFREPASKTAGQTIEHYLKIGRSEERVYKIPYSDKSHYNLSTLKLNQSEKKVAFLVHIFYPDLWPELLSYIRQLECVDFDVFVNIVDSVWSENLQTQIKTDIPTAKILVSKNQGRDIGGFIYLMHTINFDNYDIFCLLHTKKSLHTIEWFGELWRKRLCAALLKNPEKASENIALFRNNPTVGLLGNGSFRATGLEANTKNYDELIEKFVITGKARECEFIAGTMMMIRPAILKPLLQVDPEEMETCDKLSLQQQYDGLQAHALERIIGSLVRHFGYTFFWQTED